MSADHLDKEISQLYQQRKQALVAPELDMSKLPKRVGNKFSLVKLLTLLFVGSAASFGILAIINHIATAPKLVTAPLNAEHAIDLEPLPTDELNETQIVVKQALPPKPIISEPSESQAPSPIMPDEPNDLPAFELSSAQIQVVTIPKIAEPKLALKPIYKVMPNYSLKARQANQTGTIRLRYQITPQGKVANIEVVASSVGRALKKSAIHALAQWEYEYSDNNQKHYEIIFDFNTHK